MPVITVDSSVNTVTYFSLKNRGSIRGRWKNYYCCDVQTDFEAHPVSGTMGRPTRDNVVRGSWAPLSSVRVKNASPHVLLIKHWRVYLTIIIIIIIRIITTDIMNPKLPLEKGLSHLGALLGHADGWNGWCAPGTQGSVGMSPRIHVCLQLYVEFEFGFIPEQGSHRVHMYEYELLHLTKKTTIQIQPGCDSVSVDRSVRFPSVGVGRCWNSTSKQLHRFQEPFPELQVTLVYPTLYSAWSLNSVVK